MYLSRIAIDLKKYETMRALYNREKLHGMVENTFPGERLRNLWRIDRLYGRNYLLLLSAVAPQSNSLAEQIGYAGDCWETKQYDNFLSNIRADTRFDFRLTANPTKAVLTAGEKRGRVKAITVIPEQREWLKKQAAQKGFQLQDSEFDVVKSEWVTFKKEGRESKILAATFEGSLVVTEPDVFRNTLISGIGREKAYGMGLLTVMPHV